MVTMSGTIPRTGAAWIDTMFDPDARRVTTEADDIRLDVRHIITANRVVLDLSTYAGREQYVWILGRHRDKHRHQAHVEVSLGCPALATAHERAAEELERAIGEVTC